MCLERGAKYKYLLLHYYDNKTAMKVFFFYSHPHDGVNYATYPSLHLMVPLLGHKSDEICFSFHP